MLLIPRTFKHTEHWIRGRSPSKCSFSCIFRYLGRTNDFSQTGQIEGLWSSWRCWRSRSRLWNSCLHSSHWAVELWSRWMWFLRLVLWESSFEQKSQRNDFVVIPWNRMWWSRTTLLMNDSGQDLHLYGLLPECVVMWTVIKIRVKLIVASTMLEFDFTLQSSICGKFFIANLANPVYSTMNLHVPIEGEFWQNFFTAAAYDWRRICRMLELTVMKLIFIETVKTLGTKSAVTAIIYSKVNVWSPSFFLTRVSFDTVGRIEFFTAIFANVARLTGMQIHMKCHWSTRHEIFPTNI